MYFNVYSTYDQISRRAHPLTPFFPVIICIFIGAFLGSFVFHWENLTNGYVLGGRLIDLPDNEADF